MPKGLLRGQSAFEPSGPEPYDRRVRTVLVWLFALVAGGCRGVPVHVDPPGDDGAPAFSWRGRRPMVVEDTLLLAPSETAARETWSWMRDALELARTLDVGERGLVIVTDRGDPDLFESTEDFRTAVTAWNAAVRHALGKGPPPGALGDLQPRYGGMIGPLAGGPLGYSDASDHDDAETIAKLDALHLHRIVPVVAALPAPELDLPSERLGDIDWCVLLPTPRLVRSVSSQMLDFAMDRADLSLGRRLAMVPVMPLVRSKLRDEFRQQAHRALLEASFAAAPLPEDERRIALEEALKRLRIRP